MAKKIGVYILAQVAKLIIKTANDNRERIIKFGGEGLWTITELLTGIAAVLIAVIEAGENVEGDWLSPLDTLDSGTINKVHACVAKFDAANGIGV